MARGMINLRLCISHKSFKSVISLTSAVIKGCIIILWSLDPPNGTANIKDFPW